MASAKFTVEEALRTDVDLSTVNAIVGSLETQLVTSSASVQQQQIHFTSANQQINNNNSAIVSNGGPISTSSQKHHGVANGEISSPYSALNNNRVVNNLDIKTNNNNLSEITSTSAPLVGTTTIASNGNNKISAHNNNTFATNQIVAVTSQQYQTSHQQQQLQNQLQPNQSSSAIMSKNNEPVKLVYPSQTGVSQPAVINMNNRVTFTSQSLPNGTINLSTLSTQHQQGIIQTSSAGMTSVGGNTGLKSTAPQQQQPTLVIQKQVFNRACRSAFFFFLTKISL